MNQIC